MRADLEKFTQVYKLCLGVYNRNQSNIVRAYKKYTNHNPETVNQWEIKTRAKTFMAHTTRRLV